MYRGPDLSDVIAGYGPADIYKCTYCSLLLIFHTTNLTNPNYSSPESLFSHICLNITSGLVLTGVVVWHSAVLITFKTFYRGITHWLKTKQIVRLKWLSAFIFGCRIEDKKLGIYSVIEYWVIWCSSLSSCTLPSKSEQCDRRLSNVIWPNKTFVYQYIKLAHTLRAGRVLVIVDGNIV